MRIVIFFYVTSPIPFAGFSVFKIGLKALVLPALIIVITAQLGRTPSPSSTEVNLK